MVSDYDLGCGTYEIFILDRCGESAVCRLKNTTRIDWSRTLNETSQATVEIGLGSTSDACCGCIAQITPWQHELAIYRNTELVWVGPIVEMTIDLQNDVATIEARDLSAWFDKRVVELIDDDYDVEESDSKDIYEWLVNHAYCKDPWCMTWSFGTTGIPSSRFYPAFPNADRWGGIYPIVGDEMRSLMEEGVDFTVVNRHMYGGDLEMDNPSPSSVILYNRHWTDLPKITVTGINMTNRTGAAGGNGGYDGFYDDEIWFEPPIKGPITPSKLTSKQQQYGLLESFESDANLSDEVTTEDPNATTQNAFGKNELLSVPFEYVEGGQLNPTSPTPIDTLIPGTKYEVRLTGICRPFSNQYRLYDVNVTVNEDDEKVDIKLAPVGVDSVRNIA